MKNCKKLLAVLISAVMICGMMAFTVSADEGSNASAKSKWAIYMYVCGNNLESESGYATDNLSKLKEANRGDDTVVFVQTGGATEWKDTSVSAEKSQKWVLSGNEMKLVDEQEQKNMGEADTFAEFLKYASTNYPAEHTMVIMWDHGGGTNDGCCQDENYGDDPLTLAEMHTAFSQVYSLSESNQPIDIIGFDCCLMATIDVAATFKDVAHYMVASEELEPGTGWNYAEIGNGLGANSSISASDFGVLICDAYLKGVEAANVADKATLSLTDLTKINDLVAAFGKYADNMLINAYNDTEYLRDYAIYADKAENYGGNSRAEGYTDLVDIKCFVEQTGDNVEGASDVLNAINACVLYKVHGSYRPSGGGLSFYFDFDGSEKNNNKYLQSGVIDGLKVLYDFSVSGALSDSEKEYVTKLGLDPAKMPVVKTFKGTEFDGKAIQYDADGYAYADFGSDIATIVADAMYYVYSMENGETYYIGTDDEVTADYEKGIITAKPGMGWGYFGGYLATMDLTYDSPEYNLYSVPVLINGSKYLLQVVFDFSKQTWSVVGARRPGSAIYTTYPGRTYTIDEGTDVTLIKYRLEADGSISEVAGDTFKYSNDCFEYATLKDGKYALKIVVEDLYTNRAFSNFAVFDVKDEVQTYDPNGTITVPESRTAADAVKDGGIHKAAINFINNTKSDITEMYIAAAAADNWGNNCLETPLAAGADVADRNFTMTYSADLLKWGIKVVLADGTYHTFDWNLSECNAESMAVQFNVSDSGDWYITFK